MIQVRASSFGGCIKAQVAGCLGYDQMAPPATMQAIFDRGHEHERANEAALTDIGFIIVHEWPGYETHEGQVYGVLDEHPIGSITCHLDGIISNDAWIGPQHRIWESKSPQAYKKFHDAYMHDKWDDPLCVRYAWQTSVQQHIFGMEAHVTCVHEDGVVEGFTIEKPIFSAQDIVDRLISINEWVKIGQLPQLCSSRDYPCPFVYLHEDAADEVDDPQLDGMVADYLYWAEQEKNAAQKKKDVQALIRAHVDGDETVTNGGSKITVYQQNAAARYDWDQMRADGIDPDQYKIPGGTSERIKITRQDTV